MLKLYSVSDPLWIWLKYRAAHPCQRCPPPIQRLWHGGLTTVGLAPFTLLQIAIASNYRLTVLGTAPAIPVLVTVYSKNVMLGDVLRDVGYQGGRRAQVVVYPDSRTIELRYAKN